MLCSFVFGIRIGSSILGVLRTLLFNLYRIHFLSLLIHKTVEFTWSVFLYKNTRWFILNRFIRNYYYYYDNFNSFWFKWNEMTVECNVPTNQINYEMHSTHCQIEFRIDRYNFWWNGVKWSPKRFIKWSVIQTSSDWICITVAIKNAKNHFLIGSLFGQAYFNLVWLLGSDFLFKQNNWVRAFCRYGC